MNRIGDQADKLVRSNPEVDMTALTVGGSNGQAYKANLYVKLKPSKERKASTQQMKIRFRQQLAAVAEANPKVSSYDPTGASQAQPLTVNLISNNQADLDEYAPKLIARLKKDPRLIDVDSSYRPGKPEVQIHTDARKAQIYGINTKTLGDEIRAQIEGLTPVKYRENGQEYDVRVRLLPEQRDISKNYAEIYVPNVNQRLIRLTDVADIVNRNGSATIERQDRGRYVQITAGLAPKVGLGDIISSVRRLIKEEMPLPNGMRYVFSGESENYQEMTQSMILAVGFGVLFIFFVLSSLYESFITPFTIMLALPLALCGAFVALWMAGESFSLFTAMGLIMLLGVACKNSILLVDYTVRLMAAGKSRAEALVMAGKVRLRPILMTSLALIAGMIPVAIGLNEASSQRTSMGVGIIGGMVSSTFLTLIIVPAVFSYVDRFRVWSGQCLSRFVGYKQ
jgi:HAE1 family hydrophobic/amphiphilic exporter-1